MNADITILSNSMIVSETPTCSVEKAMQCADELGVCYYVDEGGKSATIYGDKYQLWEFLYAFSFHYMNLIIE